jgi:Protein of unknown function (DUF1592)/Protein of unknown function (DUF1588)/Protein of unknown function (DUF1595)/Protein of unknown function (DUF1585)
MTLRPWSAARGAAWVGLLSLLCSCSNTEGHPQPNGVAGSGPGGPSGGASGAGSTVACEGATVTINRRLVRLTLRQAVTSLRALLGAELSTALEQKHQLPDASMRAFPPLSSQEEGTFVTQGLWLKSEDIARDAATYVRQHYAQATGCSDTDINDTCAQAFIQSFAPKAFRRPLDANESASLSQVYAESKAAGAGVAEAAEQTVWAIFSSPHFLYRRELGDTATTSTSAAVALTGHELASALSFFLTDGPPDAALLDAAAQGTLASANGVGAQVDRLLSTDAARTNLEQAMLAYFGIGNLDSVVIDPAKAPTFTVGLKNAMYRETQEFLKGALFGGGALEELLTSRKTLVNPDLAALYGVTFPDGQARTADNFVAVELPPTRAGLLTQAGFLAARARPDKDSVVGRGLLVTATMLCANNPAAPPDGLKDQIDAATTQLADKTEREKSAFRQSQPQCGVCHRSFDAYGLALENFDLIGTYRSVDEAGRPIDASVTLPQDVGGTTVADASQMAAQLAVSGTFATCMTRNLMKYALAEGNVNRDDCAVQNVSQKLLKGPRTFSGLVRAIALSETLSMRASGATP